MGVSQSWGGTFWGVSIIKIIVFGVYIGVSLIGELPYFPWGTDRFEGRLCSVIPIRIPRFRAVGLG